MSADHFREFVFFEIFVAMGASLFSGTDVALLYDSIEDLDSKEEIKSRFLGNRLFYSQLGETIAALLATALVLYGLKGPIYGQALVGWIPLFICLSLNEPERERLDQRTHSENFRFIFQELFQKDPLLRQTIVANIFYGMATLVAVWSFQDYWRDNQIPLAWFGFLWAGYNLTVAVVARYAYRIEKILGSTQSVFLIGLLPIGGYLGMGLSGGVLGIIFGLFFQISRGLNQVILKDAINTRVSKSNASYSQFNHRTRNPADLLCPWARHGIPD